MTPDPEFVSAAGLDELLIHRFLGSEIYHIEVAEWNLYNQEAGNMNFWIRLVCDTAIKQFDDTAYTLTIPCWELNLKGQAFVLEEGFEATIPEGYDGSKGGFIANFCALDLEESDNNTVRIVKKQGDKLLLKLYGEVKDLNFYDGSKPKSKLVAETWFTRNKEGRSEMV